MENLDISNLEKLLKCKICEEIFDKPTILNCGHTFCSTCITGSQQCPECVPRLRQCQRNKKNNKKISLGLSIKWHLGNDIMNTFRHEQKDKNTIMKSLKVNMKCPVCCAFLAGAVATVCGHIFCSSCLEAWRSANHHDCPVCRASIPSSGPQSISWPLGDRLAEETRMTLKRSRSEDSGKTTTLKKKPKIRSSATIKEKEDVKET